jgi:hypothetical protein
MVENNNTNTGGTGQSGFAKGWLDQTRNINTTVSSGGTRVIDGMPMTLVQAMDYINKARISSYSGKYQTLKQMAGYTGKSDQAAIGYWNNFVRDLFNSPTPDANTFAAERVALGGGTSTAAYPSITSEENARFEFQQLFRDTLGPAARFSEKEFRDYYKKLTNLEKTRPTRQVTSTSNGRTVQTTVSGVSDLEKQQLALGYVAKYLNAGDPKVVGGSIATNQANIAKFAADHGINLPDSEVRRNAVSVVTGGANALDSIYAKIRTMAKVLYPGLGNFIDTGLTVADIASTYIAEKANLLEMNPITLNLRDPDIVQAISGQSAENIGDFRKRMKSNPLYAKTNNALNEVNAMLSPIKAAATRSNV